MNPMKQLLGFVVCLHGLCGVSALLGKGHASAGGQISTATVNSQNNEPPAELQDPYAPEPGGAATADDWCKQPNVFDPACNANPVAMSLEEEIAAVMKHMKCSSHPDLPECKVEAVEEEQAAEPEEAKVSNTKAAQPSDATQESKTPTANKGKAEPPESEASNSEAGKGGTQSAQSGVAESSESKSMDKQKQQAQSSESKSTDVQKQQASKSPAAGISNSKGFDTEKAAGQLQGQVLKLSTMKEDLTKKGELDPELDRTLSKMIDTGTKVAHTVHSLGNVTRDCQGMHSQSPECQREASQGVDMLKAQVEDVNTAVFQFETEVHPHGYKWWRYRWEYAFVEANLLNVLVLCTMLLYLLISWAEKSMFKFSPVLDSTGVSVVNLYHRCFDRCLHEVMILGFIAFIIWAAEEAGFFHFFITNNPGKIYIENYAEKASDFHWPTSSQHVIYTLRTVNIHLFLGMLMYYLLMHHLAHGAMCILEVFMSHENPGFFEKFIEDGLDCEHLEDDESLTPEFKKKAAVVHECFAKKGPLDTFLASDRTMKMLFGHLDKAEDYLNLKKYFAAHVKYDEGFEELHELIPIAPIYPYLARKLQKSLESMIVIDWQVWVMIELVLVVQAFVHFYAHLAVVELLPFNFLFGFLILLAQYIWTCRRLAYAVDPSDQVEDENERMSSSELKAQETLQCWLFRFQQLNFFFVCFSAARLLCSSFFWTDYFKLSCILTATFLVMYALFVVIGSLAVPMFVIMLSLPPNVTVEDRDILQEIMFEHQAAGVRGGNSGRRRKSKLCAVGMVLV